MSTQLKLASSKGNEIIWIKALKKACEVNPAGENSSFIFTVCVKSVPLYHDKLCYAVLHMAVKEVFGTHF